MSEDACGQQAWSVSAPVGFLGIQKHILLFLSSAITWPAIVFACLCVFATSLVQTHHLTH